MKTKLLLAVLLSSALASFSQGVKEDVDMRPMLFSKFLPGSVIFKNGAEQKASLNYNSSNQQILFIGNQQYLQLDQLELIDYVKIGSIKFLPIENRFYEETDSKEVFISYSNYIVARSVGSDKGSTSLRNAGEVNNTANVYYNGNFKNQNAIALQKVYWINNGQGLKRLISIEDFAKVFDAKKAQVKEFIKNNSFNYNTTADVLHLIDFLKSNQQ